MKSFQKNDQTTLLITDMTKSGEGIGKDDGFALFVKDTVPGDRIRAVITKVKKTYGYARLLEILEPSADRVSPPCPSARQCGGCQLQMMSHERQLRLKEQIVRDALERIGGFRTAEDPGGAGCSGEPAIQVEKAVSAGPLFRYRNKAVVPVGTDREGNPAAGFYAGRTHVIIPCEDCLLGPEEFGDIVREVLAWMRGNRIPAYDEKTGNGLVRHIFMRKSRESGEILVCLIINGKTVPQAEDLKRRLEDGGLRKKIAGVLYSVNRRQTNVIFGERPKLLWGKAFLTDSLRSGKYGAEVRYQISPASFYQVNPWIAEQMYTRVLELAELTGKETVFDLYCGIGTISLFLAGQAGQVIGVEAVPDAVCNARENARLNGLHNTRFLEGKAEEIIPALFEKEHIHADVVVVDPPRRGCDPVLLDTIVSMQPDRLIYVSCDPATLARDLRILAGRGYRAEAVRPYDQFVMTVHVETVVLLSREKKNKQQERQWK